MSVIIEGMQFPGNCRECNFGQYGFEGRCIALARTGKPIENSVFFSNEKPEWCPLKKVPSRKTSNHRKANKSEISNNTGKDY